MVASCSSSRCGAIEVRQLDLDIDLARDPQGPCSMQAATIAQQQAAFAGKVCAAGGVLFLVVAWCVLDSWNAVVSKALVHFDVEGGVGTGDGVEEQGRRFDSPMLLTFMQFSLMGAVFLALWCALSECPSRDLAHARFSGFSAPWPALIASHIFSTFWLQALMMPSQVMSLGAFAASRALEVPIVGALRCRALGVPLAGQRPRTVALMSLANLLIFYSYVRMEGCLCIWSGHGVWLAGPLLYMVYAMVLTIPAMNTVCQEVMMVQFDMPPLLLLGLQNLISSLVFLPVLSLGHVQDAFSLMRTKPEILLLVMWLCVQTAALALVGVALIRTLDSFWAVTLRGMRVVYWWLCQLVVFYVSTSSLLSVAHPKIAGWSFGMVLGLVVTVAAMAGDVRPPVAAKFRKLGKPGFALDEAQP
eukprot:TRINITY_DN3322_c0_g1_i1.p1 TRINITY_DN3322_c0_g1~~TRINITY_DN3322_c0_g1_i1.p1  ORF type:complete len:416 (+),score=79.25 TRINITY_DN3322_c0_g1_i1:219-1466(+)